MGFFECVHVKLLQEFSAASNRKGNLTLTEHHVDALRLSSPSSLAKPPDEDNA